MKIFLLSVNFNLWNEDHNYKEPWGSTVSAVVRSETPESAFKMIDDEFNRIPQKYWTCLEITADGPETMFCSDEYGNI